MSGRVVDVEVKVWKIGQRSALMGNTDHPANAEFVALSLIELTPIESNRAKGNQALTHTCTMPEWLAMNKGWI